VLAAARAAAGGELLFETEQLAELAARATRQRQPHAKMDQRLGRLTPREREVLSLLARGVRGEDVARTLFISPQTVQTHIRNILGKLQVRSRLEAAVLYAESFEGRSDPGAADEPGR
jgi:DNA-binding NarL/FixJ family response regulator